MRAVVIKEHGGPEALQPAEVKTPKPGNGDILVRVRAAGVNRADLIQRAGHYPAPAGAPQDIPGLEYAGEVAELGDGVSEWKQGDRVFGLAAGGTYAEFLTVPARTAAAIPANLDYVEAASIPEAFVTAYDAMVVQCGLSAGERVLITAVGSGVGTAAVQIARAIAAVPYGTSRSQDKLNRARELGLEAGILAQDGTYAQSVLDATSGSGVNVIVELVGGRMIAEDIKCAAARARIILVGLLAGAKAEVDLGAILRKRLLIRGTTLRMRPLEEKIQAGQLLAVHLAPLFASGILKPVIERTFALEEAAAAHKFMEDNANFGKIVLVV